MKKFKRSNRGFTLIASLLLLLLLSGMAIGLLMMVNTEGKVGSTDLQNDIAFHAAEGGMEKMYSDVSAAILNAQSPTVAEICAINANPPVMTGITFPTGGYFVNVTGKTSGGTVVNCNSSTAVQATATPTDVWGQIVSGPNQGLYAQIIPINLTVTAQMSGGQQVSMYRQSQIALIPVFQYGVFCEGDCAFFMNPTIDFGGRLHANGDLYVGVASGNTITFHGKLEAFGNVVTNTIPNGLTASYLGNTGDVYIPTATGDCTYPGSATSTCLHFPSGDGSVTGAGGAPPGSLYNTAFEISNYASSYNTAFNTFSASVNHMIINGDYGNTTSGEVGTGAKRLSLPFVSGTQHPYELIRRPTSSDSTALGEAREYNIAQIHVLLSDDPADLPGGASDSNNIRLANVVANSSGTGASNPYGIQVTTGTTNGTGTLAAAPSGEAYTLYFAAATNSIPSGTCTGSYNSHNSPTDTINCLPDWPYPPAPWTQTFMTNSPGGANSSSTCILLCPSSQTNAWTPTNTTGVVGAPFISNVIYSTLSNMTGNPTLYSGTNAGTYQGSNGANQPPTFVPCPRYATAVNVPGNCPLTTAGTWNSPYYLVGSSGAFAAPSATSGSNAAWNLIDGWLRVEYVDSSGTWHPVTTEWLKLGFARDVRPPTANGAGQPSTGTKNPINPNAILLLQEPADRYTAMPSSGYPTSAITTSTYTGFSTTATAPACTTSGSGASMYCTSWSVTPPQVFVDSTSSSWLFGVASSTLPTAPVASTLSNQSPTQFNWYPINFYDAREGEPRDSATNDDSCTANGVMNAVEIDVGNLARWLAGSITGTSGGSVDYVKQNGYILYFSDRRGMTQNPHPPMNPTGAAAKSGDSGLEDVINPSVASGKPNGTLDTPEDTNQNGYLDSFGVWNEGLGFYGTTNNPVTEPATTACSNATMPCVLAGTANPNPGLNLWYQNTNNDSSSSAPDPFSTAAGARIASCGTTGRKNWVSGARHVLKLVDGSLGNLPLSPAPVIVNGVNYYGGFTVASENPVYVQGDYNSNSSDTFFANESGGLPGPDSTSPVHAPAAIIADAVTFLSNAWVDANSTMQQPTDPNDYRNAGSNSYYRVAVAAGKNMSFPFPSSWENTTNYVTGTDGGVGNFLRFLEDWSNTTMHYGGSLVSMFYSTYNTGMMKCCTYSVYRPPYRDYYFDNDFTTPQGLPPGTPMFRDVESLGYRQLFTPRTQ